MLKVYIYAVVLFFSIWTLDALDFNRFLKKNRVVQARILYLLVGIMIAYLVTNFIWDIYSITKI